MKYDPKTDDDLETELLLDDGEYQFKVVECEEKYDKNNNDMFALILRVFGRGGDNRNVYDYISPAWMHQKFKRFFYAVGLGDLYETGAADTAAILNAQGAVVISTEKQQGYKARNVVVDYIPEEASVPQAAPAADDDDLPF